MLEADVVENYVNEIEKEKEEESEKKKQKWNGFVGLRGEIKFAFDLFGSIIDSRFCLYILWWLVLFISW